MAFSRKALKAMSLTEEQIDSVIEMYVDATSDRNTKISALEAELEELKKKQSDAQKYKEELEEAKKTIAENAAYKEQYEKVQSEYDGYKAETEARAAKAQKDKLFAKWLKDNGYTETGVAKILKYGGYEPEFDKNGAVKNPEKLAEGISAEWSEYKAKEHVEGAKTETPPANTGGKETITKEQILSIQNTADRQKAIAANPKLFNI